VSANPATTGPTPPSVTAQPCHLAFTRELVDPDRRLLDRCRGPFRSIPSTAVQLSEQAREVSETELARELPRRWAHVQSVAERAETVSAVLDDDGEADVLVASAWLHDVGYAPTIAHTGFHPLDGARHIRAIGLPTRVAGLVAFHSAAVVKAQILGLDEQLAEFTDEQTITRDLLWYADMTTGPGGGAVTFDERIAEIRRRHAVEPAAIAALDRSLPLRRATVLRAQRWLDHRHVRAEPRPI
jgi:hypothetical protein